MQSENPGWPTFSERGVKQGSVLSCYFPVSYGPLLTNLQQSGTGLSRNNFAGCFLHTDDIRTLYQHHLS